MRHRRVGPRYGAIMLACQRVSREEFFDVVAISPVVADNELVLCCQRCDKHLGTLRFAGDLPKLIDTYGTEVAGDVGSRAIHAGFCEECRKTLTAEEIAGQAEEAALSRDRIVREEVQNAVTKLSYRVESKMDKVLEVFRIGFQNRCMAMLDSLEDRVEAISELMKLSGSAMRALRIGDDLAREEVTEVLRKVAGDETQAVQERLRMLFDSSTTAIQNEMRGLMGDAVRRLRVD